MKKMIVALDGLKYSESAASYAIHLAKQSNSFLAGIFLDDFTYHSYRIYDLIESGGEEKVVLEETDKAIRAESVSQFENACEEAGISFAVHHDQSIALQELLHESIYADLLVIDGKETLTHYTERSPSRFIRDLLAEAQCPVVVVPSSYRVMEKIIMLYDGSPSSVFAIRMFSYAFPVLKHLETEVVTVKDPVTAMNLPDNRLMKEFMRQHFPKATYTVLTGAAETEIVEHLKKQFGQTLVVLGAYQRGMVSRWLKTSMADVLIRELHCPLFIAHN
ncbi:universal stress protein [Filimonas effusa]|uniref:Universal stress protein n=1 Tax=Filimonas effusa TaxID=2508721 RepID=A0A4Q1DCT0_9BACT|nr:universal stress protein [Filimonas effusa]RXK87272.1 universal stress protein [Filimonas effusa]